MLQEAIDLQVESVSQIVSHIPYLNEITFKAPTGSGKTYMMTDLMNQVLQMDNNIVFLVSSLSTSNLAEQNHEKFSEFSKILFTNIKPYLISSVTSSEERLHIPIGYNVYSLPRDLYKENSNLKKGALIGFLRTLKSNGKQIYLIKDECHLATNNLDELSSEFFSKIFNFSATPKLIRGQTPTVELKEIDAINAKLIKRVIFNDDATQGLDIAIEKFKLIKKQYNELLGINPCMIIQISNKDKADAELNEIFQTLNRTENQNLKWMLIVDQKNSKGCDTNDVFNVKKLPIEKWKNYAKKNTATIDIIIFKMVIKEGWDIPRACMLYQVRDSKSVQLDEQVIGRVRRNPRLVDFETLSPEAQELATVAYVWGVSEKEKQSLREVELCDNGNRIQNEIKLKTTTLKTPTKNELFDVSKYIDTLKPKTVPTNIFDLYRKYLKLNNEFKTMYNEYVDSIEKWFLFCENAEEIVKASQDVICDYNKSMEITKNESGNDIEATFPLISFYAENGNYKNISNWIWKRTDNKEQFSFDSEAEREWAEILLDLVAEDAPIGSERLVKSLPITDIESSSPKKKYLVGKNFLMNSNIKYEYYLNGIHSSYPDFIMKDYKNRIHLFETKCLNNSAKYSLDEDEYSNKINALKECYAFASKLTGYYFYIPIKKNDNWTVFLMHNGTISTLSKKGFIDLIKS